MSAIPSLNVLIFSDGDLTVAQCLEYDIAVQARTWLDAISAFKLAIIEQVQLDIEVGKQPLSDTPAAPHMYTEKFNDEHAVPIDAQTVQEAPIGSPDELVARLFRDLKSKMYVGCPA
ncbi:MAG: hypothetical protein SGI88_09930 [Candidatus Hydrogenedentes bacterium]|nr:hypothetical protein [Candidatus Hydrogenedentota bacterium]